MAWHVIIGLIILDCGNVADLKYKEAFKGAQANETVWRTWYRGNEQVRAET